jgi:asparagine synthase (glutamine-hydrolysing)
MMRRDQVPLAAEAIEPLLAVLEHRGPDGCDVVCDGQAVLGHLHFWTTPEEVGERQPVHDPASRLDIVLDGRLDNRADLAAQLGLELEELARLSDAALVLRAFKKWREGCFARLLGSFAAVIFDAEQGCLVSGRDPLGNRTIHYYVDSGAVVLASEESVLLRYPAVSNRLDDSSLARFFAARAPAPDATFFGDIKTLPRAMP